MAQLRIPPLNVLHNTMQGQCERNVVTASRRQYLSLLKTLSQVMERHPDIRGKGLDLTEEGLAQYYSGEAEAIYKFLFPLTAEAAQLTFANLSIDGNLAQKSRRTQDMENAIRADEEEDGNDHIMNPAKNIATMSSQSYQNFKSALKWWHEYSCPSMDKITYPWPPEVETVLKNAVHSYKRDTGLKKRKGVMKSQEGMKPFSLSGYIALSEYFNSMVPTGNRNSWAEGLFASSFLKISVNTIGRSDNIDDLMLRCMDFINDAMVIKFMTTKNDQEGEVHSELKRLFANPYNPTICIFLDLIIYTFCKHRSSEEECVHLYGGNEQNKRYYTCLKKALAEIPAHIDLGCSRSDIGTHSNRKFAESTSASKIDGPSRTQVSLRAGQSVGRTQDCYMFIEEDGDAIVGRTVAQLKLTADEFDVLPPHFSLELAETLDEYGWENIYPGYQYHPVSFQRVIRNLFPSLVYHYHSGHLEQRCCSQHPIWRQRIFTDRTLINSLKDEVILTHGHCKKTHMSADGVPGFILISREVRNFQAVYNETCEQFKNEVTELRTFLHGELDELPKRICTILREQFEISGAVAITKDNIRDLILELLNAPDSTMSKILHTQELIMRKIDPPSANANTLEVPGAASDHIYAGEFHLWSDNDRSRRVPKAFVWPTMTTFVMWDLWFFGDKEARICPYRRISGRDDLTNNQCRSYKSRTGKVICALVDIAVEMGVIEGEDSITLLNGTSVFDFAFPILIETLYAPDIPTRPEDIVVTTLYNRMKRYHENR